MKKTYKKHVEKIQSLHLEKTGIVNYSLIENREENYIKGYYTKKIDFD